MNKVKLQLINLLTICTLFSCQKEIGTTTYIDGRNINIDGKDTTIYFSKIDAYNSGNSSELVTTVLMTPKKDSSLIINATVVYSLLIPDLKDGDIIVASAKAEVTSDLSYEFLIRSGLNLTSSQALMNEQEISEPNGFNLYLPVSHGIVTQVGTFECANDVGDKYVNFGILAFRWDDDHLKDKITVEQDYGRLSVIVYKK